MRSDRRLRKRRHVLTKLLQRVLATTACFKRHEPLVGCGYSNSTPALLYLLQARVPQEHAVSCCAHSVHFFGLLWRLVLKARVCRCAGALIKGMQKRVLLVRCSWLVYNEGQGELCMNRLS